MIGLLLRVCGRLRRIRPTPTLLRGRRPGLDEQAPDHRVALAHLPAAAYLKPEQFLFPSRVSESPHVSTRQYSRIVGSTTL
jgi:hypothetical protein